MEATPHLSTVAFIFWPVSSSSGNNCTACDRQTGTMADAKDPENDATERALTSQQHSAAGDRSPDDTDRAIGEKDVHNGNPAQNVAIPDSNIVDWDGPDDPANPRNWSKAYKMTNIALVSFAVLYTNLATTLFAPAASLMQAEFGFESDTVEILTITIASLGFAVGQLFVAPLSEVFGRLPIYRASSIFYLGFTAGCARSTHVAEFLVFRLCTGLSAASYMSTGGGTVADLLPKEERGLAMAMFTAGPLFGPVTGPIVGGFVTQDLSWRWTFYLVLMLAGAVTIASFVVMRETSAVAILKAKAARLRKETGNPSLRAAGDKQTPINQLVAHALIRPIKFLVKSPIVSLTSVYIAFNFGVTMLLFATFPLVFQDTYHWTVGISGLAYIGVGVGCAVGIVISAKLSDRLLRAPDGKYRAERRLILMMYVSPVMPIGLFIYGWTTQYKVHWILPIIGTAISAPGVVVINSAAQTYLLDIFGPLAAASAIAAMTLLRNLMGAFVPLAAPSLYANLGLGWGNSVLAFVTVAFIPVPFFFYWRGEWLREKFPVKI
ncbi:major facilitator superfamily domain-containing protein [Achaetomium macrosporum]|uniref:Major facilitator superfamily domain-containing protein n=1 Tax=Achaetomium macrosporum TaxID=79813 RepID=A0AAN7C6H5_9PEZI|nr:major facilitator superfamily domain-containing protein [Achaetomium macrosporum]